MKAPLLHVAGQIFDQCLAVLPERLDVILHYLAPRLDASHQSAIDRMFSERLLVGRTKGLGDGAMDLLAFDDYDDDYDSPQPAQPAQPKKPYALTDAGVAIIPIKGTLLKKGDWMSAMSGCTSYAAITNSFTAAIDDTACRGILLDIDSPGGTTHGCFELADLIYSSRSSKPIFAAANDLAASAAYALGSSAERLYLTRTGAVGSIGVFMLHCDQEGADKQMGLKYTYIFAGDKKVDGNPHESLSRSAKRDCQAETDRQYQLFIDCVSRNRSASPTKIQDTEAGVFSAATALPLLADSVGTFDDALAALTKRVSSSRSKTTGKAASTHATIPHSSSAMVLKTTAEADIEAATAAQGDDDMPVTLADLLAKASPEELQQLATLAASAKKEEEPKEPKDKKMKSKPKDTDDDEDSEPDDDEDDEPEPEDKKKDKKGKKADDMEGDDMKKSKKSAKKEEKDEEEDCEPGARKAALSSTSTTPGTVSFSEAVDAITDMCSIGKRPDLVGHYTKQLAKGKSLSAIREAFQDARAADSAANPTDSAFGTAQRAGNAVDEIIRRTATISKNANVPRSRALISLLSQNPDLYQQAEDERAMAAQSPTTLRQYVEGMNGRMKLLGLSSGEFGVGAGARF